MAEVGPYRRDLEQVVLEPGQAGQASGLIRVELVKMLRRPRTWVIIGMLVALPTLVAILLADHRPRARGPAPARRSCPRCSTTARCSRWPRSGVVLPLFLPIAVAVLGGDAIAGETQTGTLRYLLVRPVGRTHLLLAKLVTVVAFVVLAVLVVAPCPTSRAGCCSGRRRRRRARSASAGRR